MTHGLMEWGTIVVGSVFWAYILARVVTLGILQTLKHQRKDR